MSVSCAQQYFVIPLAVQKEGDFYLVGNSELGDFYQFPEEGVAILGMLQSGDSLEAIRSKMAAEHRDPVDVDGFVGQLSSIGFIHSEDQTQAVQQRLQAAGRDSRRIFSVDPKIARAVFSPPALVCYAGIVLYAAVSAILDPSLRLNVNAFYIETNRTALLVLVFAFSILQVALHECGHMLAAARHGVKSKYGIGTRLWTVVAESDLTGILALPRSQRYFPMLAGPLVDVLCAAILTILLQALLDRGAGTFTVHVVRALILGIVVSIPWQLNIFVKTDIYFAICNYFGHPDLDREARVYLRDLAYRASFGRFGTKAPSRDFRNLHVLRLFSLIWLVGRVLSLLVLVGVFLPTMVRYIASATQLLSGPPASIWMALDTLAYVSLTLTMLATGMYMWIKQR
jgi:putative peptide zinc metalloprotease protein